jgi:hypothetical protein
MAAIAVVDEVEDAEALEAADASLSDRLDFSCIFAGEVVLSRYRQCTGVGKFDMIEANWARIVSSEARKGIYEVLKVWKLVDVGYTQRVSGGGSEDRKKKAALPSYFSQCGR